MTTPTPKQRLIKAVNEPTLVRQLDELIGELNKALESERQARLSAETKLRELQDAIKSTYDYRLGKSDTLSPSDHETISRNIQNSRTRNTNENNHPTS